MIAALKRNRRGGIIVEYAIVSLLLFSVLFSVLEFGVEMFVRQTTERAMSAASQVYSDTGDLAAADIALRDSAPLFVENCFSILQVTLYDSGAELRAEAGRTATGTSADLTAELAGLSLECTFPRLVPITRGLLGPEIVHAAQAIVRLQP